MNKNILLLIALVLIGIGIFKPDFSSINSPSAIDTNNITFVKPTDSELLDECAEVTKCFANLSNSSYDAKRLASLYSDIAQLIELDEKDEVIKNTEEIRQANRFAGLMLKLDIKGKYPDLADKAKALIVASIGDDNVPLDPDLRKKAVDAFRALAWACNEGAK